MTTRFRRTRIVATLGPASSNPEMISKLVDAGVNVFRLNFSHGKREAHRQNVEWIRAKAEQIGRPVGVLQDLQGPKIRVATFADGKIELAKGQSFALTCDDDTPGDDSRVGVTYKNLYADVAIDDMLLLDDGRLSLQVTAVRDKTIHTSVVLGGTLSNNKGINIPGADLSIPGLTDKDVEDLEFGAELDVDWVAISFVRSRDDVVLARHYLSRVGSRAKLMAKIEKPSAVTNFPEILEVVDGIMVARGDLGVELSAEKVPLVQKRLIREARKAAKPVITATQMLESMISSPQPTRAEANDVANAICDGTDAVMLSAETAVGSYPVEAVAMMDRIALTMEDDPEQYQSLHDSIFAQTSTTADAVALSACRMAEDLGAKVVVSFSQSGATVLRVARNRFATPVIALTPDPRVCRQLSLCWGTVPMLSEEVVNTDQMVTVANRCIQQSNLVAPGDRYIVIAGVPFGIRGTTNMIRVERTTRT